jgi:hypothetical protein
MTIFLLLLFANKSKTTTLNKNNAFDSSSQMPNPEHTLKHRYQKNNQGVDWACLGGKIPYCAENQKIG